MVKDLLLLIKKPLLTALIILMFLVILPFESSLNNNLNPLIFGISFFIVNKKAIRQKLLIGFSLSILFPYLSFFVGLFSLFGILEIVQLITNSLKLESIDSNIFIVISGLIASLTLYFLFTKVYKSIKLKKGLLIMLISYSLVPFIVLIIPAIFDTIRTNDFFVIYNLTWLLVVGFFLPITLKIVNKEENETRQMIKPIAQHLA